jgi:hypothetical protein
MLCKASRPSSRLTSGETGGGFSTITMAVAGVLRPRVSLQVAPTVMDPEEAPEVSRAAVLPLPEMLPPLAVHWPTVNEALSGLVQVQSMVDVMPA